jgi:general nucleoside transport system ATP-binding protein
MSTPLIEMRGISKRFGSVHANTDVDLVLGRGEILGLLGENGAGKTTLMNILFGVYAADAGTISVNGRHAHIRSAAHALAAGIGMVHQHFHLAPRLSVLDNLLVGLPGKRGLIDRSGGRAALHRIETEFGLSLDPARPVSSLSVGEQQRLEIIKALFRGARVLILDEPTAVLTPAEVDGLFTALRAMAAQGLGIIFISHKLNEVRALTSRCVVLRHGKVAGEVADPAQTSAAEMARLMCGHEITAPARTQTLRRTTALELHDISTAGHPGTPLKEVSLSVLAKEIVGIAGVSGNGQSALAGVIAGTIAPKEGRMLIGGEPVTRFSPRAMMARGVGRIPEDRMTEGLVTSLPLADSMVLPRIRDRRFSRMGILKPAAIETFVTEQIQAFDIRCPGPSVRTGALSGGNLQKALLARELAFDPTIVVAAQPTRGLDIGAARFVHDRFLELRERGCGLVVISEDLEELLAIADRIAVMYEGRIAGVLDASQASVERIGLLMSGVKGPA